MAVVGFDKTKGKGNGIKSMCNFRFERDPKKNSAYSQFPSSCAACYNRLQEPSMEKRYGQPRDTCYLWPIMEMRDEDDEPTGRGYKIGECAHLNSGLIVELTNIMHRR